jgi:hypothetical protein
VRPSREWLFTWIYPASRFCAVGARQFTQAISKPLGCPRRSPCTAARANSNCLIRDAPIRLGLRVLMQCTLSAYGPTPKCQHDRI